MATQSFARFGGLGLYTETPLHCGAESGAGYVDLPIQRERHTRYPVIPGATIKGVLRDELLAPLGQEGVDRVFGAENASMPGTIAFLDAMLVAFPVRSSGAPFHWVSSPFALSRLWRALGRAEEAVPPPDEGSAWAQAAGDDVALEEIVVRPVPRPELAGDDAPLLKALLSLIPESDRGFGYVRQILGSRFLVVSDDEFRELTETATEVVTRIKLNYLHTTTTVKVEDAPDRSEFERQGNLFVEELVPTDTLFFAPMRAPTEPDAAALAALRSLRVIRFGGDETIGRGLTHVTYRDLRV